MNRAPPLSRPFFEQIRDGEKPCGFFASSTAPGSILGAEPDKEVWLRQYKRAMRGFSAAFQKENQWHEKLRT
jgi:hypothetical protein